jgi:hypothetical protein
LITHGSSGVSESFLCPPSGIDRAVEETKMLGWLRSLNRVEQIALLGVVATLLAALPAYFVLIRPDGGAQEPTATGRNLPTVTPSPATTEPFKDILLSFAGKGIRETCDAVKDDPYATEELGSLTCFPLNVTNVTLILYDDSDKMNRNYYQAVNAARQGITPGGIENCLRNKPSEGEWRHNSDITSPIVGRLLCAFDATDGNAWLEWTYEEHNIHVYAFRGDKNIAALFEWWQRVWSVKT